MNRSVFVCSIVATTLLFGAATRADDDESSSGNDKSFYDRAKEAVDTIVYPATPVANDISQDYDDYNRGSGSSSGGSAQGQ